MTEAALPLSRGGKKDQVAMCRERLDKSNHVSAMDMLRDLEAPDQIELFCEIDWLVEIVLLNEGRVTCLRDCERGSFQAPNRNAFALEIIEADSSSAADIENGAWTEQIDCQVKNFLGKN